MTDDGHAADRIIRWVIRKSYGIRNASAAAIARYRYWHAVSRSPGGFTASGPWEQWLSREIPPGAVVPEPSPLPTPAPVAANERNSRRRKVSKAEPTPKPATTSSRGAKRRGRPPKVKQARALLRERLADGPKSGTEIEAAAQAAEIPKRDLLAATDALRVRTQRGQWWVSWTELYWWGQWWGQSGPARGKTQYFRAFLSLVRRPSSPPNHIDLITVLAIFLDRGPSRGTS